MIELAEVSYTYANERERRYTVSTDAGRVLSSASAGGGQVVVRGVRDVDVDAYLERLKVRGWKVQRLVGA